MIVSEWIGKVSNNDNEIGKIYREDDEYIIQIDLWNGEICRLKTIGCKSIYHRIELVDEIGNIVMNDGLYRFMTVDTEEEAEIILEIEADRLTEIE